MVFLTAFVAMLLYPVVLFASQDGAAASEASGVGFTTYAGLAVLTTIVIGAVKKLWPGFVKGKEALFALGIPIIVGCVVKAVGVGFEEVIWTAHIAALFTAGIGAGLFHDKVVNPVIANKPDPKV